MQKETFEVEYEYEGERLDKYVSILFPEQSRSFFQKLIKDGNVSVNDKIQKANYRLKTEDLVTVEIPDAVETQILPEDIPLDILYEDDDLLVVNKPKGMVVHPSAGHYSGTLVNAIMYHCKDSLSGINGEIRPGIVHRIDMDTTGSLIVCKNDESHVFIAEQIKEHSVNRRYRGIVYGVVRDDEGTIHAPIGRHPVDRKKMAINEKNGKDAITHYKVLERFDKYTYMEFKLSPGRTAPQTTVTRTKARQWPSPNNASPQTTSPATATLQPCLCHMPTPVYPPSPLNNIIQNQRNPVKSSANQCAD